MNDVIGTLHTPTGHVVKVVPVHPVALNAERLMVFPTLTDDIIVAINVGHLCDTVRRNGGDYGNPSDEELDIAMMEFVPDIAQIVMKVIEDGAPADPFGLAAATEETQEGES
jgi:hypothetical protein